MNRAKKLHIFLLLAVMAVFIWSFIKPAGYLNWALEAVPTIFVLIVVIATYNRFRLTTLAYIIIALLAILTFVGGHYTYSKVPLFTWIKEEYGLNRNHYDRFGHLLKGLLGIVIREILLRKTVLVKGGWLLTLSISVSLSIAALYEIIEWLATRISKGGKATKEFLGMQGDIWDAQWDMALALAGTILGLILLSKLHDKLLKTEHLKE